MIQKRPKSSKPSKAARARGRPKAKEKLEKLVAYLPRRDLAAVKKAARRAKARSLSSWVSQVLAHEAEQALGTGEIPLAFFDLPIGSDPKGSVRKAVREERDSGW